MHFQILLISLVFAVYAYAAPTSLEAQTDPTTPETKNKTSSADEEDPFGDRINLNWSKANAHAANEKGQFSGVNAESWGVQTGILNVNTGKYVNLGSKAGSNTQAYSSGEGAPKTWAQGNSNAGPLTATGGATAGFSGGKGTSHSESHSKTEAYDLGNGFVLLSNLNTNKKPKKNKTKPVSKVEVQKPTHAEDVQKISSEKVKHPLNKEDSDVVDERKPQSKNGSSAGDKPKDTTITEEGAQEPENESLTNQQKRGIGSV